MSLREYVAHEVENLDESELQAVAEYVSFLKFRSRFALEEAHMSLLYREFESEDKELAESGMENYAAILAHEDAQ